MVGMFTPHWYKKFSRRAFPFSPHQPGKSLCIRYLIESNFVREKSVIPVYTLKTYTHLTYSCASALVTGIRNGPIKKWITLLKFFFKGKYPINTKILTFLEYFRLNLMLLGLKIRSIHLLWQYLWKLTCQTFSFCSTILFDSL